MDAEEDLSSKRAVVDQAKLVNLALEDQINFSTITLQLYQRDCVSRELSSNEKNINRYRPHLGLKVMDGLKTGWYMLEEIIAFIIQFWTLFVLGGIGFWLYNRYWKK